MSFLRVSLRLSTPIIVYYETATTEIYTLSLHDALPIFQRLLLTLAAKLPIGLAGAPPAKVAAGERGRSEEHTSELQSRQYLVCRLLLEKKNRNCTKSVQRLTMY